MGGRQRLYQKDHRITVVVEDSLAKKIEAMASSKGLTVSRFVSLMLKQYLEREVIPPLPAKPKEIEKPKVNLSTVDFSI